MKKIIRNTNFYIKFLFITGIILVLVGNVFVILSFQKETLDNKYKIDKVTTYSSVNKNLAQGEMYVTKDIKYISEGVYKVTYKTHVNRKDTESLLSEKSTFNITDILGDSYELIADKITINDLPVSISQSSNNTDSLKVTYYNNTVDIIIPSSSMNDSYVIETYIKLKSRETSKKHITTKEAYYSFTPSIQNDKYYKKTRQSYVINGSAYIVLSKK